MSRIVVPKGTIHVVQLHMELLDEFPSWRGLRQPNGSFIHPLLHVQVTDTEILLDVPDGTDAAVVDAVVKAHVPKPRSELKRNPAKDAALAKLKATTGMTDDELTALGFRR